MRRICTVYIDFTKIFSLLYDWFLLLYITRHVLQNNVFRNLLFLNLSSVNFPYKFALTMISF